MSSSAPVILVTGSSRGLGLAIVKALLDLNTTVVALSRTKSPSLTSLPVHFIPCDITQPDAAEQAVQEIIASHNRLDGLILNAGTLDPVTRIEDASLEDWKDSFNVNLFANISLLKPSLPFLRQARGSIIFISSGAAVSAYQGWSAYSATKAAVNSLALSLSLEEPEISTLAVRPGAVDTEMQRAIREEHGNVMGNSHGKFIQLKEGGKLLSPMVVGRRIAMIAISGAKIHEWSGKFVNWDDSEIANRIGI